MKIVSWNVNGLAACMRRGLPKFIGDTRADVVCLQEIKTQCPLNLPGYPYQFWNPAKRKGYSGTLTLSRKMPLSWSNGIGIKRFDDEGRLITVEYDNYYIVNVYVPNVNTSSEPGRADYRLAWNKAFRDYLLSLGKPIIVCGDLNVAHRYIDIYPQNQRNAQAPPVFSSEERSGFERLLSIGLTDAFRFLHPYQTGAYTWWGPKNMNRGVNRGSRLDYFLVSDELLCGIRYVEHHDKILGSDHCPISMLVQLTAASFMAPLEELGEQWRMIDWKSAEKELQHLRKNLAQAAYERNWSEVWNWQKKIVRSNAAKILAVREIADSGSAAGIDGVRLKTDAQKMQVVRSMVSKGYLPRPNRAVEVSDGTKIRTVDIPVARDKAMLVLYKYALDPISEATADKKSFSARKGRSPLDAYMYLYRALSAEGAPEWIVIIDVKAYYDSIIHDMLLRCIPMDRDMLSKFLQAGYIRSGELFPKEQGISLGTSLSPILGNMLLDGLQSYIYDHLYPKGGVVYTDGEMFRFADDIVITARTRRQASKILDIVKDFLERRGLAVNHEKTYITNISDGFDFLSRHFQKRNNIIQVWPSVGSIQQFIGELDELIDSHKGTQRELIERVNRKLTGWAAYHRVSDAYDTFRQIDATVEALLLQRMSMRYPRWHQETLREKFWIKENGFYIFALKDDPRFRVIRLAGIERVEHEPVNLHYNPYLDPDYFMCLKTRRDQQKAVGKYKMVWQKQEGRCAYCGSPMLFDQDVEVVERELGKGRSVKNLQYIHRRCAYNIFAEDARMRGSAVRTLEILQDLADPYPERDSPYYELTQYFHFRSEPIIVLTFADIERITGITLEFDAHIFKAFWYDETPGRSSPMWKEEGYPDYAVQADPREYCISDSWITQGYEIKKLELPEKRIVFRQTEKNVSGLVIPKALLRNKLPDKVVDRANKYLASLAKECGLI